MNPRIEDMEDQMGYNETAFKLFTEDEKNFKFPLKKD